MKEKLLVVVTKENGVFHGVSHLEFEDQEFYIINAAGFGFIFPAEEVLSISWEV